MPTSTGRKPCIFLIKDVEKIHYPYFLVFPSNSNNICWPSSSGLSIGCDPEDNKREWKWGNGWWLLMSIADSRMGRQGTTSAMCCSRVSLHTLWRKTIWIGWDRIMAVHSCRSQVGICFNFKCSNTPYSYPYVSSISRRELARLPIPRSKTTTKSNLGGGQDRDAVDQSLGIKPFLWRISLTKTTSPVSYLSSSI